MEHVQREMIVSTRQAETSSAASAIAIRDVRGSTARFELTVPGGLEQAGRDLGRSSGRPEIEDASPPRDGVCAATGSSPEL